MKNKFTILFILLLLTSCTKTEVLFERELQEDYELALILNLNGKDCFYDAPSNTLKYTIDENNLTDFSPKTVFQDYSEVKFDGRLLYNNRVNNFGTIVLNKTYNLEIKISGEIKNLNLVFTKIPLVQILTFDKISNEPKILGKIIVNYPCITTSPIESYVGIELRGSSIIGLDKKSYNFRPLNSKNMNDQATIPFFDMDPNYKWSLDAMFTDPSKVRNKTSFEIWSSLSNSSIKSRYVEVFLNNESLGLYRFYENYTQELLQLTDGSSLYVGNDNTDFTKFEKLPDKKPKSALWGGWEQIFPNPSEKIYWDDFYQLSQLVVEADSQLFCREIGNLIDLDNVIDYYLFINLSSAADNVGKNWYFVRKNSSSKFKILLWDLDDTWGRKLNANSCNTQEIISNRLFMRLITENPDGFKQKLKARWLFLRTNQFSEASLLNQFDSNFKEILDYDIVATENQIWHTNINLINEQQKIDIWVNSRLIFLDDYFYNL